MDARQSDVHVAVEAGNDTEVSRLAAMLAEGASQLKCWILDPSMASSAGEGGIVVDLQVSCWCLLNARYGLRGVPVGVEFTQIDASQLRLEMVLAALVKAGREFEDQASAVLVTVDVLDALEADLEAMRGIENAAGHLGSANSIDFALPVQNRWIPLRATSEEGDMDPQRTTMEIWKCSQ